MKKSFAGKQVLVAQALVRINPLDSEAMAKIMKELAALESRVEDGPEEDGRDEAIEAVSNLGPKARVAVPMLLKLLRHKLWYIRMKAADALGEVADESVHPILMEAQKDEDDFVRESVDPSWPDSIALSRSVGVRVANPILCGLVAFPEMKSSLREILMKTSIGKHRDPAKEQLWRRVIADQARSGLSVRAYCRREGLKHWNFQWWRRELTRRDRQVASAPTRTRPEPITEPARSSAFLPVVIVEDTPVPTLEVSAIEIVLPAGPIVRVNRGFDSLTLDAVLSVLEARRC